MNNDMLRIVRVASYFLPFALWLTIAACFGIYGTYTIACLISAIVGGAYLSYYVVSHGMTIGHVPTGRVGVAIALCLVLPAIFYLRADRIGSATSTIETQSTSSQSGSESGQIRPAQMPIEPGEQKVDAIMRVVGANPDDGHTVVTTQESQGFTRRDPVVVKTGDGTWEIKFHMPGTRKVETPFPLYSGKVYYVSTNGLVENMLIGRVTEAKTENGQAAIKQYRFLPTPASEFCGNKPVLVKPMTNTPGVRLAFSTELVPPGDYTIKILESSITPREGEHSPGVPLDRWYQ